MGPRNALGYGGHIHLGLCARIRIARVHFRCAKARSASLAIPELTRSADIKLNERVSLRPVIDSLPSLCRGHLRHWVVHRVQKFVEVGSGRIGYPMIATALSEVSNGAKWNPDPSFNVADAILADPEFASVLKVILRDGHIMDPALKAKGK